MNIMTVCVAKGNTPEYSGVMPMPQNCGGVFGYSAKQMVQFLKYLRYNEIILTSDQVSTIKAPFKEVKLLRGVNT